MIPERGWEGGRRSLWGCRDDFESPSGEKSAHQNGEKIIFFEPKVIIFHGGVMWRHVLHPSIGTRPYFLWSVIKSPTGVLLFISGPKLSLHGLFSNSLFYFQLYLSMFYIFPNTSLFWSIYARCAKKIWKLYIYSIKSETLILRA